MPRASLLASLLLPLLAVRVKPGPAFEQWLRHIPPAVFAALVLPELLIPGGKFEFGPTVMAGFIGVLVAWRTLNITLTILAGIGAFALLNVFM